MSQIISLPTPLSPASVALIKTAIAALNAIVNPIVIAITKTQKKGLVSVASNRSAEIDATQSELMEPFPVTIPNTFTLAQFIALKQEQIDSNVLIGLLMTVVNELSLHAEIVGNNRMLMAVEVLDNARILSKTNNAVKVAYRRIKTDFLTPSPKKGITTYSIAPSATLAVTGLKNGKKIINNGTTILTVLKKMGNADDTLIINPGDSKDAPIGWTNVSVTNLSATTTGCFQVYL